MFQQSAFSFLFGCDNDGWHFSFDQCTLVNRFSCLYCNVQLPCLSLASVLSMKPLRSMCTLVLLTRVCTLVHWCQLSISRTDSDQWETSNITCMNRVDQSHCRKFSTFFSNNRPTNHQTIQQKPPIEAPCRSLKIRSLPFLTFFNQSKIERPTAFLSRLVLHALCLDHL